MINRKYIQYAPVAWKEDVANLKNQKHFLVERPSPTIFIVIDGGKACAVKRIPIGEGRGFANKVCIGNPQSCSCFKTRKNTKSDKLCVHIMFVMLKVLRLEEYDSLAWQTALTESEITRLLTEERNRIGDIKVRLNHDTMFGKSLVDSKFCPICHNKFKKATQESNQVECIVQCGRWFHEECVLAYSNHMKAERRSIVCPVCKQKWSLANSDNGSVAICHAARRASSICSNSSQVSRMPEVKCCECSFVLRGVFYRRVRPYEGVSGKELYDLCRKCFAIGNFTSKIKIPEEAVFVSGNALEFPVVWSKASLPASARIRLQAFLNHHNMNSEAYSKLHSNTNDMESSLENHIVMALELIECTNNENKSCAVCKEVANQQRITRVLTCANFHVVHEECALKLVQHAISNPEGDLANLSCPACSHMNSGHLLFPTLLRKQVQRKSRQGAFGGMCTAESDFKHTDFEMENQTRPNHVKDTNNTGMSSCLQVKQFVG